MSTDAAAEHQVEAEAEAEADGNDYVDFPEPAILEFLTPRRDRQQPSPLPTFSVLCGPPKCGKTSLLLQAAYNLAMDDSALVVFLCKPKNFENDQLYISLELDHSGGFSERIQIKYIKSPEEISQYFAAFHLHEKMPTAVIVDDFVDFFGDCIGHQEAGVPKRATGELPLVKALSLCHNATSFTNETGASGQQCRLILSDTHSGEGLRLLYIFKRWFSYAFVVRALEDESLFSLEIENIKLSERSTTTGIYLLENQILHFEGMAAAQQEHSLAGAVDWEENSSPR